MFKEFLIVILCGILIGTERELKNKDAGVKTILFIILASYIYTLIGIHIKESGRIIAQIISGVGFIGSGTIIFNRDKINGLTSAAIIWLSSAVGVAIALDLHNVAIIITLMTISLDTVIDSIKGKVK